MKAPLLPVQHLRAEGTISDDNTLNSDALRPQDPLGKTDGPLSGKGFDKGLCHRLDRYE